MLLKNKKGQASFGEYAVLIAVVIAAVTTMQVYFRRGLQGGIKAMADRIDARQYSPTNTESTEIVVRGSQANETLTGMLTTRESTQFERRQGEEEVNAETVEENP